MHRFVAVQIIIKRKFSMQFDIICVMMDELVVKMNLKKGKKL